MTNLTDKLSYQTSKPEEMVKLGFERFGLKPIQNYKVGFFYIDFAFPDIKVGLEIDSFEYHKDIDRDRRRHDYITLKGWKLHHFRPIIIYKNKNLIPAFLYLKYFNKDEELIKVAKYEIYKLARFNMTNEEQKRHILEIINTP